MKHKILKYLTQASLFIAVFFLPFKTSLSNIGFIGLIASTALSFLFNGISFNTKKIKNYLLFSPFIFIVPLFIGYFYSPFENQALDEIIKYIFLLLVPMILFRKDDTLINSKSIIEKGLIIGCLISSIMLLTINTYNFFIEDLPLKKLFSSHFTGFNFLAPFGDILHPIYVGSYFIMALSFLFFSQNLKIHKGVKLIISFIFSLFIVFINSRITFFSFFLILLLLALEQIPWKTFAVFLTTLIIVMVIAMPFFKQTYIFNKAINGTVWELTNNIGEHNTDTKTTSDSRMSRWIVGWELLQEKPFLGYGTGTENEMLLKKYKENNMRLSASREYNAHNQILGYLIRFGIIGAVAFIFYFFGNVYKSIRRKDLIYISFLLLMGSIFCIENYLDRNMGINLFVLFGSLFLINKDD